MSFTREDIKMVTFIGQWRKKLVEQVCLNKDVSVGMDKDRIAEKARWYCRLLVAIVYRYIADFQQVISF